MNKYLVLVILLAAITYSVIDIFIEIPNVVNKTIGLASIPFALYFLLFYFGGAEKIRELKKDLKEKIENTKDKI